MALPFLAYLAGLLTILSPCILPVLPFVFSRVGHSFRRSALPLLAGMAVTFATLASLAALGGGWVVQAHQWGRMAALAALALFGVALLWPALADRLSRSLVRLGAGLSRRSDRAHGAGHSIGASALLGVAVGLLWAPCAGPILGLILTGAALRGGSTDTALLLLAYGLGAATSLAVALLAGSRLSNALKRSQGACVWMRRGLGAAVLAAVGLSALGLEQASFAGWALADTNRLEQALLARVPPPEAASQSAPVLSRLPVLGILPPFPKGATWLNSPPLSRDQLWGKVVLVDIWTYSCINCVRTLPHVRAWASKYKDHGLVVIGVHSPEFAFERDLGNVRAAVRKLGITYPVVIDNNFAIWKSFRNTYWPSFYFIDSQGRLRHSHFGEGAYDSSERTIQELLREAGQKDVPTGLVRP
ncbi:cytochrome c biogenesis protein DipZ [Synechococcus sp. CS-1332]|uniref:cytochrome c biogenesis protein DipZ n=1 Tax=Synechococcus sp. CS-1332 TaxID=2847972 RepID=UPI00223AD368|nr:cytochrome c biogenesis protein DipZ [Synechococcus sp. CS-1332]MCT0206398.1 cytochrome c biogenesis protein DipZ [Synechococcus sp. CS-1332]